MIALKRIPFAGLSSARLSPLIESYVNRRIDRIDRRKLVLERVKRYGAFSLRRSLQALFAIELSIDWEMRKAAAKEVANQILSGRISSLDRRALETMKQEAMRRFDASSLSDLDIVISTSDSTKQSILRQVVYSTSVDSTSSIQKWLSQKGLIQALTRAETTNRCPWCGSILGTPVPLKFLIHLKQCNIALSMKRVIGFDELEIDALLRISAPFSATEASLG